MSSAIYVSDSSNSKLSGKESKVDATYSSIKNSCPSTCMLKNTACYAQQSFTGLTNNRLEKSAGDKNPLQVARDEANAIKNSYNGKAIPLNRVLRLHVSGDSRTVKGTRLINSAVGDWKKRGGGACYSYTHSWRQVRRAEWSNVSILASVDNISEVAQARKQGYAPAIVVSEHPSDKTFKIEGSDTKWIPCPAQTRDNVSCVSCRLCFDSERLFEGNYGVAFAAHGIRRDSLKRRLTVLQ